MNDGGPAFPNITPDMNVDGGPGMSLRDYFAIHADVTGFEFHTAEIAGRTLGIDGVPESSADTEAMFRFGVKIQAEVRYRIADAMLTARLRAAQ